MRGFLLGFFFEHKKTNKKNTACTLLALISLSKQCVAAILLRAGEEDAYLKFRLITAL